jgi:hypothetical protein
MPFVAPNTVHALAAALVQVTNTRSTPVPNQDVDIAARHPFTASCNVFGNGGAFLVCYPTPAPPTSGYETVIQNVNVGLNRDTGNANPTVAQLNYSTAGGSYTSYVPMVAQGQGPDEWVGNQTTAIYLDPAGYNPLQCSTLFYSGASATLTCTVTGYTVALP